MISSIESEDNLEQKRAIALLAGILAKQKKYIGSPHAFDVKFTRESFPAWLDQQSKKQEGKCHYCETSQADINLLIDLGILQSKRFKTRGRSLEIERLDSNSNCYSAENCALICYFCNNDKSDVVSSSDYKFFFAEAKRNYIEHLLTKVARASA